MSTTAPQPVTTPIPVQLSESEFTRMYLAAPLDAQARAEVQTGYHRVFNLILWILYTGMQWKCLPSPQTPMGSRSSTTPRLQSLCQMGG